MSLLGDARNLAVDHGLWWPAGDPGRLRHLADDWRHRGDRFESAAGSVRHEARMVAGGNVGAAVDAFLAHACLLAAELDDHADRCRGMARALDERADQIEAARRRIEAIAAEIAATLAVGFFFTALTGGLSDVAAADLTASLLAEAAALGISCSEVAAATVARVAVFATLGAWDGMLSNAVGQSTRHLVEQHELVWSVDLHEVEAAGALGGVFGGTLGYLTRPPGALPPVPKVPVEVPPLEEAWSAGKSGSRIENLMEHFGSHRGDFPEIQSVEEYVDRAWTFLHDPPGGTLSVRRTNGDLVRYQPSTNTFGILDGSGVPRTLYKPDLAVHGYSSNMEYFSAQKW
ncbi:MAG: hypothetical protein JWN67_145 [Actinomycetia bacterium]|nr:hypothetical protein [Actinomycetes bacterium]